MKYFCIIESEKGGHKMGGPMEKWAIFEVKRSFLTKNVPKLVKWMVI